MTALDYLAGDKVVLAVLDLDHFVDADLVLLRAGLEPDDGVVCRDTDERGDFCARHALLDPVTFLKLSPVHENVELSVFVLFLLILASHAASFPLIWRHSKYTLSHSSLRYRRETLYGLVVLMSRGPGTVGERLRENLKALREMRGLTQAQIGSRAGIAAASISHFETGQRVPALDSLVKLADALGVSTDILLGRASVESSAQVDPVFLRASRADARTLETVRRITETLLAEEKQGR